VGVSLFPPLSEWVSLSLFLRSLLMDVRVHPNAVASWLRPPPTCEPCPPWSVPTWEHKLASAPDVRRFLDEDVVAAGQDAHHAAQGTVPAADVSLSDGVVLDFDVRCVAGRVVRRCAHCVGQRGAPTSSGSGCPTPRTGPTPCARQ